MIEHRIRLDDAADRFDVPVFGSMLRRYLFETISPTS